jgi:hypothetical protein
MPLAALMVHVDMDHDSEETVELAIALAEPAGCIIARGF